LGTNLPDEVLDEGLGDGEAAEAVSTEALYTTAPATPPTNIDPAIAAAATDLRIPFTSFLLVPAWGSLSTASSPRLTAAAQHAV
jgi:hypothetical protein